MVGAPEERNGTSRFSWQDQLNRDEHCEAKLPDQGGDGDRKEMTVKMHWQRREEEGSEAGSESANEEREWNVHRYTRQAVE